jgi:hypothetical protein
MNTYSDSEGNRYSTPQIDSRIKKAKQQKLEDMDYPYCETCKRSTGVRLDMSHIVSVKYAKENSCCELCWDVNNIELLCRECHMKHENLSNLERLKKYETKN